jgi:hypothetical protein
LAGKLIRCASRALDIDVSAEPDGAFSPFLPHPAPALLERHAWHRSAHTALIPEIQSPAGREEARAAAGRWLSR